MKAIVGLCGGDWGGRDVGMDATAEILDGMGFVVVDLLDPVKRIASSLADWDGNMDADGLATLDRVCRSGRQVSEDYWLNSSAANAIYDLAEYKKMPVVVKNVFFRNEHLFIGTCCGILVKLVSEFGQKFETDSERVGLDIYSIVGTDTEENLKASLSHIISNRWPTGI